MQRKTLLALAVPVALGAASALGWLQYRAAQPIDLVLRFHACVGPDALVLNEYRYANPGGAGRFAVRDFQLLLSNIRLIRPGGAYAESDSYHLVRFDGVEGGDTIVLHGVPRGDYQRIEIGIGVDPAANRSITVRGDLDPNGRMAWTWDVGYKFVLFEGTLDTDGTRAPLVYHVGFEENYAVLSFPAPVGARFARRAELDFRVDVRSLFEGPHVIDMATLGTVKFDHGDAALLARNYADMISPMRAEQLP